MSAPVHDPPRPPTEAAPTARGQARGRRVAFG